MALAISHQLKIFVCILEVYKTADLQTTATLKATRYFQAPTNSCGSNISFEHVNILLESFPSASKYNHHILEEYNALYTSERDYIFHVKKRYWWEWQLRLAGYHSNPHRLHSLPCVPKPTLRDATATVTIRGDLAKGKSGKNG